MMRAERIEQVNASISSNWEAALLFDSLVATGEALLREPPVARPPSSLPYILDAAREVMGRLYALSLLARTTRNQTWIDRAVVELLNVTAWTDWNADAHFLDTAELMHGVGVAVDALYWNISSSVRGQIVSGMVRNGLAPFVNLSASQWWSRTTMNWGGVCNGACLPNCC
jgi:hypothetical protein